jgi:hypothetical protein
MSPEPWLIVALVLFSLLPIPLLAGGGDVFNGSTGLQVPDHMQYLGFIRDAGENVLFSNRFDVAADPHLFFHPMFALSGVVWQLTGSIQAAFLIWQPVAVVLLAIGFSAYARRLLSPSQGAVTISLVLAFFYLAPATYLTDWLGDDARLQFGTLVVGLEPYAAAYTWGAAGGSISVALMPLCLLGVERALEPSRRRRGRSTRWYALWAGVAGMLSSWLHPWQGITLLAIMAGLVVWERFDRRLIALVAPVALTAAPLAYMWVLTKTDSSWAFVSQANDFDHVGDWLVLGFAPAVLALPAYFRSADDTQERMLRLWPPAALVVYFVLQSSWFYHAFAGLSLPLAILAVKGLRHRMRPALAVAAVALATVPGIVYVATELRETRDDHFFTAGEMDALQYLDDVAGDGSVLAPVKPLGQSVPGFAGRKTFVGHYTWTPDYESRRVRSEQLFDGRLDRGAALDLVRESGARFLAADCGRPDLRPLLGELIVRVRRFGCATVYEVAT